MLQSQRNIFQRTSPGLDLCGTPRVGYKRCFLVLQRPFVHAQRLLPKMLRNERDWFPRFIHLCKLTKQYNDPFHTDHARMVKVVGCVSFRHVQSSIRECQRRGDLWVPRLLHRLRSRACLAVSLMHKRKTEVPYPSFLRQKVEAR